MGIIKYLSKRRIEYTEQLDGNDCYYYLSSLTLSLTKDFKNAVKKFIKGKTLDAGGGNLSQKKIIQKYASEYLSLDIEKRNSEIDIICDIQKMNFIKENIFDSVVCTQVLEHVPEPEKAINEIYRILKKNGKVIISVPHLSGLHEEPNDYFRYTNHGIEYLVKKAGFKVEYIKKSGGLLSFIFHPISFVFTLIFWKVPVIKWIFWLINLIVFVIPINFIDKLTTLQRKFPANILIVGVKE